MWRWRPATPYWCRRTGAAVLVPPGVDHGLFNTGSEPLRLVLLFGEPQSAAS
jgi:mannose-6-phosphate isomerase-like protein (cupin superfamily)